MNINKEVVWKSFLVSFLYVSFSTYCLIAMSPDSGIYWDWAALGLLITFPVSFLGFGCMFAERDYGVLAIVQLIVLILCWIIVYKIWMSFKK